MSLDKESTRKVVIKEIENVLKEYPEYPYQAAFRLPELRQQLIAYVLSHNPNCSTIAKNSQSLPKDSNLLCLATWRERLLIKVLIRGGILHLLRENAQWVSHQIHQLNNSGNNLSGDN